MNQKPHSMKTFDIKDEDLYAKFKAKCAIKKKSMSEVVENLISEYVEKK